MNSLNITLIRMLIYFLISNKINFMKEKKIKIFLSRKSE